MQKKRIVVVGSSNTDMVMRVDRFPAPGETIMGKGFMTNLGGKGANQAVACARLGGNTAFVAKVGDDSLGQTVIESLGKESMDVSFITTTSAQPTGTAFIMVDSHGENSIIVNSGANGKLSKEDIDNAEALIRDAGIVLMQLETPVDTLAYVARKAREYGAFVVLNPAPAPTGTLPSELLSNVDLLIPNETEARQIAGLGDEATPQEAVCAIKKSGVQHVVMTLGAKGALAEVDGEMRLIESFKVEAVDTTAAGDTFCGALCVAFAEGKDMVEAVEFANKAASVTVTRMGAQQSIPYIEEII